MPHSSVSLAPLRQEPEPRTSRRAFLALAATLPFVAPLVVGLEPERPGRLVMREGWVLRADDVARLAIA